jgi:hypothetical protein
VIAADFGNGPVLGSILADPPYGAPVQLARHIDGQLMGEGSAENLPRGIHHGLATALNILASRGQPVRAGMLFPRAPSPAYIRSRRDNIAASTCGVDRQWNFGPPTIQRWHARSMTLTEADEWGIRSNGSWTRETAANWAVTERGGLVGRMSLRTLDLKGGLAGIGYWVGSGRRGAWYRTTHIGSGERLGH